MVPVVPVGKRQGWPELPFAPRNELVPSELHGSQLQLLATSVHWGISNFSLVDSTTPPILLCTKPDNMRVAGISSLLLLAAGAVQAATSWTFDDATVSISNKKSVGEAAKES